MEEQRFFIPNHTPGDDDAAFKERLKNMGKGIKILMINLEYQNNILVIISYITYKDKA